MTKLERNIGYVMRIGVAVAIFFMLAGLLIIICKLACNMDITYSEVEALGVAQIWDNLVNFNQWTYLFTGLLFLIFTPILRVVASLITFALEHDKKYVIITSIVLLIIFTTIMVLIFKN